MLTHIPTHLIAGPLGAGKTSLIRQLLAQRPAHERWAVLINEFGQIGLDAALLSSSDDGIAIAEVAGGCVCCVNGAPFQVGLGRLLRKARPDRLLIEPSGLGHPVELLRQLRDPPWEGVLALQPSVMVLDAAALATGQLLPDSQREALLDAGLVLLNKAESLDSATCEQLAAKLPNVPLLCTTQGRLDIKQLPGIHSHSGKAVGINDLPTGVDKPQVLWRNQAEPICQIQASDDGWSIGWRWHPSQRFELMRLQQWLAGLPWRRAKLVLQTNAGWLSGNALDGAPIRWQASEWRKDSRLELIFAGPQDEVPLKAGMEACRLGSEKG
ncbi:CobW family GTP-binding protein [Pseudomonas resinovorans]|uniref:CobW family GTP-binding protein n=1 Tax=Metapseudomonas resinovorans TaxID=53412 RepID=A0ABT4XYT5_METRE|nr:CobW family GTP-binding protein [Pseudomonas resinovorans]MDA8481732.1 CobW family GTP-binding protein [Pseudomonas resinovorans]